MRKRTKFRHNMRHRLDTVEGRFKAVRANLEALPGQAEKLLASNG